MRPLGSVTGRLAATFLFFALICLALPASGQTTAKPAPSKPATSKPRTSKPSTTKPAAKVPPAPPPASDVRYKVRYTTGDQVTESRAYLHGTRERFELSDMILIRQHDQNRAVQISRASKTYLVTPLVEPPVPPVSAEPVSGQKPPGVVLVTTTIVDTGERKEAFGQQARHVKTMIERVPQPGACDSSKARVETDGWFIDVPKALVNQRDDFTPPQAAGTCRDDIRASQNGDAAALGFPIAYTTTFLEGTNKPAVMSMEVVEFEVTRLDAALFEIPEGLTAAMNAQELSKAVSNANEEKLAAEGPAVPDKKAGTIRIAVPDVINRTSQEVDTRALRTRLIAELAGSKMDAIPLAAMPQADLERRAKELGCDFLLISQITELKASKPGGLSRMMKATAGQSDAAKDITEAKFTVQLVPAGGGKARYSTNTSAKDGGVGLKTGLGLARVAGSLYLRYASPLGALNSMGLMNMGGMGMLGNPLLMQMSSGGMMGTGSSLDRTAAAGMFLMDQAMAGASSASDGSPSFDAALGEALEDGAKKILDNLKR
ncbi:MAG TPA: hypothetical protein VJM31_16185 [Vicinamibacterales bacterium]|nr:hypothetical protein [Vicinamibacterales bacterium]